MAGRIITTLFTLLLSTTSQADIAVIVNADNDVSYNNDQIRKVFLSKIKAFPNGEKIQTYTLPSGSPERQVFVESLIRRNEANLQSYWSRVLFSAKGRPPKQLSESQQMKAAVAKNEGAIGFIDAKDVDDSVRVIAIYSLSNK